jgi:DNA-binding MarR family transcriptional regulator
MAQNIQYRALAEFRYEIRRFLNFSERAARAAGLEPQQHQGLMTVKGMPKGRNATVGYVAEHLQIRHHSAVELVNRLEKRGLLRRARSRGDRREVWLKLTPRGEKVLQRLAAAHQAELRSLAPKLLWALRDVITQARRPGGARRMKSASRR